MTEKKFSEEISANLVRSDNSIEAAQELANKGYWDFAASRAYYAVFYASVALLLDDGVERSKHSGVIAYMHQEFVKTGKLNKEQGKGLNWLFELRSIGDYGVTIHVTREETEMAIATAKSIIKSIKSLIK